MKNGLMIDEHGNKWWYKDDYLHNENGPAIEYPDGYKVWIIEGKRHRLDGPAEEYVNGIKHWYYECQKIDCSSQKEFEEFLKSKGVHL